MFLPKLHARNGRENRNASRDIFQIILKPTCEQHLKTTEYNRLQTTANHFPRQGARDLRQSESRPVDLATQPLSNTWNSFLSVPQASCWIASTWSVIFSAEGGPHSRGAGPPKRAPANLRHPRGLPQDGHETCRFPIPRRILFSSPGVIPATSAGLLQRHALLQPCKHAKMVTFSVRTIGRYWLRRFWTSPPSAPPRAAPDLSRATPPVRRMGSWMRNCTKILPADRGRVLKLPYPWASR